MQLLTRVNPLGPARPYESASRKRLRRILFGQSTIVKKKLLRHPSIVIT